MTVVWLTEELSAAIWLWVKRNH